MDLLPPYGSVFPLAPAERSWDGFSWSCPRTWVRLRKTTTTKTTTTKTGIFRRSRACHNSLLQPALSPRNPVVGVHIEGLAQPVALHNRLSRPVGHLRTLPWRNPMAPARLVDPDVERKTKCLPSACQRPETYFVPSLPQETTAPSELPSALLGQWGGGGGGGGVQKKSIPPSTYLIYDIGVHILMNWKVVRWWWKWSWRDADAMMLDGLLFDMVDVTVNTCNLKSWKEIKTILLFKYVCLFYNLHLHTFVYSIFSI